MSLQSKQKKLGFWIIGASSVEIVPDAIVMPDLETHVKYIKYRENHNYLWGLVLLVASSIHLCSYTSSVCQYDPEDIPKE